MCLYCIFKMRVHKCVVYMTIFDMYVQVRSLGAVLKYLDKKRIGIELEEMGTKVPILCVRRFTL